jgi:hypothetical protein
MAPTGDNSRTRSGAEIPATSFQLLYEFERRLDEKLTEARRQTREDTQSAVTLAVSPILPRLDAIEKRMDEGNRRFEGPDARLEGHSDKIEDALALLKTHQAKCPLKKPDHETSRVAKKGSIPWWLPLLAGGALAFVGERAARGIINSLADPPPSASVPTP